MTYTIREIVNKTEWENFVLSFHPNSLLQSWQWGKFSSLRGDKVFYLGVFEEQGNLVGVALFTKVVARRGSYLTCHGGPLLDFHRLEVFESLLSYLKDLAKRERVWFIRLRLPFFHSEEKTKFLRRLGFIAAPMYFQAEYTLHLDLTLSEGELLAKMRKNTRYGIARSKREEVLVNSGTSQDFLDRFYDLYQTTVARQNFVAYPKEYFEDEVRVFSAEDRIQIFLATYQGEVLAGAIVVFYGDFAYYHHGASKKKYPQKHAPYAVLWQAILTAKRRDIKAFDFWGVAPTDDPRHPRAGLTFFKKGFGGKRVRWQQTMDLPFSWKYWLTYGYVRWERLKRRL